MALETLTPELIVPGLFGLAMIFGDITSVAALLVVIYAFYHLIVKQQDISPEEKLIWAVIILVFNLLGAIVYFASNWIGFTGFLEVEQLSELERLAELRDKGALTEEEYSELKENIIEEMKD